MNICNIFRRPRPTAITSVAASVPFNSFPTDPRRYHYVGAGINTYRESPLSLCVNDIHAVARLWQDWGVPNLQSTKLLDHDADTQNIKEAFRAAVRKAERGDVVVPQYSGHGSYLPCKKERDGKMEIICPVDIHRDFEKYNLADTFFAELAREATRKGVILLMFPFDCCHTGGMTRQLSGSPLISYAARYLPAPSEARWRGEVRTYKDDGPETNAVVMLGGCQGNEVSYEFRDVGYGACTWGLQQAIKELREDEKPITLRALHTITHRIVTDTFPTQHPVLEGNTALFDAPLFA